MATYASLPVEQDPQVLFDLGVARIQETWPDWDPATANLDAIQLEAVSAIGAQVAETASAVATDIYLDSGERLDNLLPQIAVAATGTVTLTAKDTAGPYTIDAGSVFGIDTGGTELITFQLVDDAIVPGGSTTLAGVSVTAVEAGEGANNLTGAAVIVDAPPELTGVTFTTITGGGQDAETTEEYLDRLTTLRRLRAPRPITADDFGIFAREMVPGVARAGVLDGYDPADGYTGGYDESNMATWTPLAVTVTPLRDDGEPADSSVATAVDVLFNGDAATNTRGIREVNWKVTVADPHYTTIAVTFTATTWEGWDPASVSADAVAALQEFLSPANWGRPTASRPSPSGTDEWENVPILRAADLYALLRGVDGLKAITALTFGKQGTALAGTDYTLEKTDAEPMPLSRPGTITPTVT